MCMSPKTRYLGGKKNPHGLGAGQVDYERVNA